MNSVNEPLEIYKHLTYTELFNYDIANKILKNWDVLITQLPEHRQNKLLKKKKDYDITLSLKKLCKNTNGQNLVKYNHSKGSSSLAKGRLFATSVSLQNLPRELRGALATGKYYDIDMVNAHPVILAQYCKKNSIDCKCLDKYVKNRDIILEQISLTTKNTNKDKIKKTFLSALNGGEQELDNKYYIEFKKELKLIHLQINTKNKELEKVIKRRKDYNINGSITNTILCDIENQILLTSVSYLINKGYNIDVLVFDGLMIRNNKELPNLEELSLHIKEKLDYDIKFIEKPLINIFNFDKIPEEIKEEATYLSMKEEFEKTHFKILYPPLYVSEDENGNISTQSRTSLIQTNEHVRTKISKKNANGKDIIVETSFIDEWIRDPTIRKYDKLEFYPNRSDCPVNHYNMFKGFKAENYEPINNKKKIEELIKPIIYHLKIVAQDNYDFILLYFAHIIQLPSKKTNVNIVVSGKDGTGKSIIFDYFRNMILGKELSSQTDDADELFCRFSNIAVNKLFIQIDEICRKDFEGKKAEKLKNITVSPTINYEKKGVDTITLNNYSNTVMTTNNEFTIVISQTDRRNVFFKCKETHMQDPEYFSNLVSEFNKEDVARAFYEYLMNYKLKSLETEWNEDIGLQQMRPITQYHKDIKKQCIAMDMRFLSYLVDDTGYSEIQASELYKKYCDWFDKGNYRTLKNSVSTFGYNMSNIEGITKEKKTKYNIYQINREELKTYLQINNLYDDTAYIN
jgi:hypothetical protein